MKRAIVIIISVGLIFAGLDFALGCFCNYKLTCINSPLSGKQYYVMMRTPKIDMLILGSSNANHNLNSNMLRDSLRLKVYNASQDAMGMLYQKAVFDAVIKHQKIKYVLFGLFEGHLNGDCDPALTQFNYLYGVSPEMTEELNKVVPPLSRLKYLSAACRFNSTFSWLPYVDKNNYSPDPKNGFDALPKGDGIISMKEDTTTFVWDDKDKEAFIDMLATCKRMGIKCILCTTPQYKKHKDTSMNRDIHELASKYGMMFLDYTNNQYYLSHPELFKDEMHLNYIGADILTKDIIRKIEAN
jgi:hypothetical protein